jgi:PAS domain S-box-containing protein
MEDNKLHESQYARSLIEASLDPLISFNKEGIITDMNQAKIDITGVDRNKLLGSYFFDYFSEPKKARAVFDEVFAKGFISMCPLTFRHKNGKLTDVLFNGSVYKDTKGNVLGAVLVARDIAEQKMATELRSVNIELAFQNDEKVKRAAELILANKELAFQNDEKEKRAAELILANKELAFQNDEKEKRAAELILANEELAFQNDEKEKRAAELILANKELVFQNQEKEKRAAELILANKELVFQNEEKEKRAAELSIADKELVFQNKEKGKRAAELILADKELLFQSQEKEKRAAELILANKELVYQNEEKEKRAAELSIADKELIFQNQEKGKRAAELILADKELIFQNKEKGKRAAELILADKELVLQNLEKERREIANQELVRFSSSLKLASQYSLSLIEASLDPLVTISPKGKITDMNEATVNITGISRDELTDTDFFEYFTEAQKAREVYQEVFANGSVADSPLTIRHKDGKLTPVLFNGSVYKDDKGNVLGAVVVARDITEQKRIATELTDAMVFAELATGLAEEAKTKAENAVKSKQQFLSNMSHEIRTPMNAIIGFTKVLLKTELTEKQREYLTSIKLSGDSLIVLINDILDLAKVDAGKMTFEQIPFKLAYSVAAMLHLFETKIQEKNLELVKEYDKTIPEVLVGDPVRLHQIILNLISNAVKFTSQGKIIVSIQKINEDELKVEVQFSITDTGIGIAEDKLDRIFDNFQQASSGTSRLYGGTGLGLAIVKQLVEAQFGRLNVKSIVGEGSTFSFILPFLKTKEEIEIEPGLVDHDADIVNIKVLVAEDIAINQLLMKTLLEDFGFECDIANNGKLAIEKMKTKAYDVVLMDLQMPEMNGFETTEYIRTNLNSTIPIIALTADVTTVDLAKCKSVGMDDYIAKPVDDRLLYSKIVGLVKRSLILNEDKRVVNEEHVNQKCTNMEFLRKHTRSNPSLMKEMITLYLEQTPPLLRIIKQSVQIKDWTSLYEAVHKMIPSFSIVGISKEYEDLARKIQEYAGKQQQTEKIYDMVLQIEGVCNHACAELTEELNVLKNGSK